MYPLTVYKTMSPRQVVPLLKQTYAKWSEHEAPRLGASVAFYSVLSFAPILVLITAVIALIFGQVSAQSALVSQARQFMGDREAETVQSLLKSAQKPSSGIFSSVVAFVTLLFGASGVFNELQDALNLIWDAPPQTSAGFLGMVKQRLFSFGMVLSIGFLLLVSLIVSSVLAYLGKSFGQLLPVPAIVLEAVNFVVSFAVISALFGLMFRYVPRVKVPWRDAIAGAIGTAFLFTIGKFLLGLYLGKASVGSTYGAAGSFVAVVVWIYYSAQILFFGAEFTHVYSQIGVGQNVSKSQVPIRNEPERRESKTRESIAPSPLPIIAITGPRDVEPSTAPIRFEPGGRSSRVSEEVVTRSPSMTTRPVVDERPLRFPKSAAAIHRPMTRPRLLVAVALGFVLGKFMPAPGRRRDA